MEKVMITQVWKMILMLGKKNYGQNFKKQLEIKFKNQKEEVQMKFKKKSRLLNFKNKNLFNQLILA